ncbi:MAG: hypothetical protein ACKKL4_00225 [Patescibacteria group bacterium]
MRTLYYFILLTLPTLAFAQTFKSLVDDLVFIINASIGIIVALSVAVFFYGMAMYVFRMGSGSTEGHTGGYNLMMWGILIFFVMASVWGIVNLVAGSFF